MIEFLPRDRFVGRLLPGALSAARCGALVEALERRGFDATAGAYPADYRDNDRLVFDDPALAAWLFEATRAALPDELAVAGERWRLRGLNARFRACRYRDGQAFTIHRDGAYVPADGVRSHLTLQLYLDDVAAGGRTRFYADAGGGERWAAIAPRCGDAIVFDHRVWHDGEAVTTGRKHVLRTDVMYERVTAAAGEDGDVIGRHRGYVWRAIGCRDGSIASAGRDGTVRRWGRETHALGAGSVTALVETGDGRLWCGTRAGRLIAIDGGRATVIADDLGAVLSVAERAQGGIVIATSGGRLIAFDGAAARAWSIVAHHGWAWCVAACGDAIVSCGDDGVVAHTDAAGRSQVVASLDRAARAVAIAPSGELLVGDVAGWVHRLDRGAVVARWRAHTAAITSIACAPDGRRATASEDGSVRVWRDQQLVGAVAGADFMTSVAFDRDGALVCAGYDGAIRRRVSSPTAPSRGGG